MEITLDILLERRDQLLADKFAIDGALQQVDWTIAKLDEGHGEPEMVPMDGLEEDYESEALAE